jgi:hypothetical protein
LTRVSGWSDYGFPHRVRRCRLVSHPGAADIMGAACPKDSAGGVRSTLTHGQRSGAGRGGQAAVLRRHHRSEPRPAWCRPSTPVTTCVRVDRYLDWHHCAKDCRQVDGHMTRRRAVIRADSLDQLTCVVGSAGGVGVRTIIDLRNDVEREAEPYLCGPRALAGSPRSAWP